MLDVRCENNNRHKKNNFSKPIALRADVSKYRPEVGKTKFLRKPPKIM